MKLPKVEIKLTDDLFVKLMICEKAGTLVEQHVHAYDHITVFATGFFRVWKDDVHIGDYRAPTGIVIEAGKKHGLLAMEDNSLALCIHNVHKTGEVAILPSESVLEKLLA